MGKEVVLFKNEQKMSSGEAAKLLRKIAKKIEAGKIVLEQGKKRSTYRFPDNLKFK